MRKEDILSYVETNASGTVLSFPERGPWGDSNYRGIFSGWIPAAIINRYECQSVSEIFAGSGTTSDFKSMMRYERSDNICTLSQVE